MPASKKPRKRHVPRVGSPYAGISRLMAAQVAKDPMTDDDAGELEIVAFTALDAVARGHGTTREWDALARCLNQAWTLAHNGVGQEAIPVLWHAQDAMKRVAARFKQTGKVAFDGDGLQRVREALSVWADQLRISTVGEIAEASRLVEKHYTGVQMEVA